MNSADPVSASTLIARAQSLEDAGDALAALHGYDEALRLEPRNPIAYLNRGNALMALGRLREAEAALREAALLGAGASAHLNLGNLYLQVGQFEPAARSYGKALELRPGWEAAAFGQLCVLHATGSVRLLAAIEDFLARHPAHPEVLRMRLDVWSTSQPERVMEAIDRTSCLDAALLRLRAAAAEALFDHGSAMADRQRALDLDAGDPQSLCALAFATMTHPDVDGPAALLPQIRRALPAGIATAAPPLRSAPPYRVGYLSGDYRAHPAANFLMPYFLAHRRDRFQPIAIANLDQPDAITARIRTMAPEWLDLGLVNDQAAEAMLRAARLDVLVDFSGWTGGNRLPVIARRIAPVQITAIGVYLTTGIPAMDFRICDVASDPLGLTEHQHSETLLRTDGPQCCYCEIRPIPAPPVQPAHQNGYFTFGFFNNAAKITRPMVDQWIEILRRVPDARLKILGVRHEASRRWLMGRLQEAGVSSRVSVGERVEAAEYDRNLGTVDLALDSYPYNGGTTTIECLLAGVPVLTHSGPWSFSRSARVFLDPLDLSEWAVGDAEAFVERAVSVATGPLDELERLRAELPGRVRHSALMDPYSYIERWEAALHRAIELRRAAIS